MASLVERLRVRSDRRPIYTLDESDEETDLVKKKSEAGPSSDSFERFQRPDTKEGLCQGCGKDGDLWSCETCTYSYHVKCLLPAPRGPIPSGWKCPDCVGHLIELDKILDCEMRPRAVDDSNASELGSNQVMIKHYLVKWKGRSYLHCIWVPETEFVKAYKSNPRLRTKVNNFHRQASSSNNNDDENLPIRPDWTSVDRIIACREVELGKEYLVKWKELPYDECSWEMGSDIESYQSEIEKFERIQSRKGSAGKQKSNLRDPMELKNRHKDFQQYESSPDFLSGGSLHPYQLEGLNFLRFAWSKQTHVILADEMGLGKTIQSIAFLASLFGENISPHLVVAPLSTLRNWEREFATWAPHMNVVMYVGTSQARTVIREYEFYYPKNHKKIKKKKTGQSVSESKQDRIKFDVLLTSYEMINMDSSSLKPIKWECMIVDEGHRLKNKDSKLFSALKQYSSRHLVLLTGTPLQNNLDELFMLMHFLDAGKFASLEDFQEEFKDINQEEQISRLHKMLAPHLLRRVKKDVMKELPPKKELILRVELSSKQKEYYKAILTRNYQILTRKGGPQISLINVVMELCKLCCHPFMWEGVEPEDNNEFTKQLLESSGKLQLLDKMMIKLKEQGHRVLIYSQFQHMLDLLEDYCNYRKWYYERIDGKVTGAERQIRIDRFNAKNSTRFCFLLSTRAGGLGINLATADTVIIYDSDWNPHADLQAMARAHRLGQTNKVMIFRLITRGTIEERMMQMTRELFTNSPFLITAEDAGALTARKNDEYKEISVPAGETHEKQVKLVQDENMLLENILRTLLQELVLAAVESGEAIMQYGQSIVDEDARPGQIPRLLDIVLYLCEKEHVEGGMIFQLLEDLTEMSTMRNCKDVFGYIESKQDILGKPELFARGKFVMLRICNQLLRRLSKDIFRKPESQGPAADSFICCPSLIALDVESKPENWEVLSRSSLLLDLVAKGVMNCVTQEVKDLYHILEHEFLPIHLALQVQPLLTKISKLGGRLATASSVPEVQLSQYVPSLEKLAALRLLQRVSQVYQTMTIDNLSKLIPFFDFPMVEKISVDAVKNNFLAMKVDYRKGAIFFGNKSLESEGLRDHLSTLAESLSKSRTMIYPPGKTTPKLGKTLSDLVDIVEKEHKRLLARKSIIEKRKEEQERQLLEMEREEEAKRLKLQKITEEAEQKRLATEFEQMKTQRIRREIEERELEEAQALLQEAEKRSKKKGKKPVLEGEKITKQTLMELAVSEQLREKQEMEKRLQKLAKTMDYLERAKREEAAPLIEAAFQNCLEDERGHHEREQQREIDVSRQRHAGDLVEKRRLGRMLESKIIFKERVLNCRKAESDKLRQEREHTINTIIQSRKEERDAKRKMIYFLRTEEERQRRLCEEEEARKLEEMERRKKEEAERKAKLDEIAEKQRQRERELEEKERQRREEILGRSAAVSPKTDISAPPTAASAAPAASSGGKYVPRWKKGAAEVGQAPPPATDRWSGASRTDDRTPQQGDRWRDDRKPGGPAGGGARTWQSSREQERRR